MGRVREEKDKAEDERRERAIKKTIAGALKSRKVAIHFVFPMVCGSRGSTSRLAKAAGAEPAGQTKNEKLHAVPARSNAKQICK